MVTAESVRESKPLYDWDVAASLTSPRQLAMPFDTKKTLDAWKKAKPFLLPDTGVSGALRTLPGNPSIKQLDIFKGVQKELEGFMENPKIKAERKAIACLMAIHTDIGEYLLKVTMDRHNAVEGMGKVLVPAQTFCINLEKQTLTYQAACTAVAAIMKMRKCFSLDPRIQDLAAVPRDIFMDWNNGEGKMMDTIQQVLKVLEDAESPKSQMESRKLLQENAGMFRRCYNLMERAQKTLKTL